jgi:phosphoserine phosphatase
MIEHELHGALQRRLDLFEHANSGEHNLDQSYSNYWFRSTTIARTDELSGGACVWGLEHAASLRYDQGMTYDQPVARVAILDVDGTMHPRSIGLALLDEMGRRGLGRADAIAAVMTAVGQLRAGSIDFPEMVARSTAAYAAALAGAEQAALTALARETWQTLRGELFAFVRPLIARLMEAGVAPYIVSSSPHEIVALLAAELGVKDCDGSRFEVRGVRYTVDCHSMPGAVGGKLTLLRQFAAARGASLSRSLALGNGPGDIEVLAAVGRPLVFEAGSPLSAIARTNNWPQVDRINVLDHVELALVA